MKQKVNRQNENNSQIEQIRLRMEKRGWKQAELARRSGVSTGVLSRFFNNDGISDKNLFAVLTALGFFNEKESIQPASQHNEFSWELKTILQGLQNQIDSLKAQLGDEGDKKVMSKPG